MHGRKLVTSGTVAALAILAIVGGCREATTGPTSVKPQDFASAVKLLSGNQQSGAVGAALPEVLSIKVVDAGGQPVAGATVLWQVRGGGGSISPPASTSSSTGLASVTWTLGTTLGANKAVAILQGNFVLDSVVFTATAQTGPAQRFVVTGGNLQTARVASTLPQALTVNVKDQFGYPVKGARVTWAAALFSGTVTPMADSTDANGNASASWTLGTTAIGQSVTATVTGLTPVVFNATGTPDLSRVMTVTGGSGQTGAIGSTLATPLSVLVKDSYGNLIAGETVVWNDSIGAGGSVSPTTSLTNASGVATSTWTLGGAPGAQTVRARVSPTVKVSFSASGTLAFTQVYTGNYQACGIATNDRAYCWGYGEDGQLGKATSKTIFAPSTPVTSGDSLIGPFLTFRSIQLGRTYGCGVSVAKQLYCWGRVNGNLVQAVPTAVTFTPPTTVNTVATGERHHCMTTPSGLAYCTGTNDEGELGNGTTTTAANYAAVAPRPLLLPLESTWSTVSAGSLHSCGMPRYAGAGTVKPFCWGFNSSGQIGNTSTTTQLTPTAVALPLLVTELDSTSLVVGAAHSCAIVSASTSLSSPTGSVLCWGSNGYGQLGTAVAFTSTSFSNVAVAAAPLLTFTSLTAGEYHTCGVTTTGQAYCWGRNSSGQLGDGTLTNTSTPVLVGGALTWRSLSAGELFTCGVAGAVTGGGTTAGAGTIYCWGDNEYGQLGTGTSSGNSNPLRTPQRVSFQP